jgi:hypothetical protein
MTIVTDTSFLEKKYQEYVKYELPFFQKLLLKVNDKKAFESKKILTPIIEQLISELDGDMSDFFTKRSKKVTINLIGTFGYQYYNRLSGA